jgi:glycosyltransferase involved in cell wall biosynthesis
MSGVGLLETARIAVSDGSCLDHDWPHKRTCNAPCEDRFMRISVVIPSKDSPNLIACIDSIVASASRDPSISLDITVVDSSHDSPHLELGHSDKIQFKVISKNVALLEARILGILASHGEAVLNLDSDQTVHPDLLPALAQSKSPSVVIPELPTDGSPWTRLVHRTQVRSMSLFRRSPSSDIAVIPRFYLRDPLMKALNAISSVTSHHRNPLPTRHEDTILFLYFLKENRWNARDCVAFIDVPIYHPVPQLPELGRKTYRYGRDLGHESRKLRKGELKLDPAIWHAVYRVDYSRLLRYFDSELGLDISGLVYDLFRSFFYGVGFVRGFVLEPLRDL